LDVKVSKARYFDLCETEATINIFSQCWWLDAIVGKDNWDVALVEKNGGIVAALPYCFKNKFGFKLISHPPLTRGSGPWLRLDNKPMSLSLQKEYMNTLIDQIPIVDYFFQLWRCEVSNWLPFYWAGFSQTSYYTYQIKDISDAGVVLSKFDRGKRKNIRKAMGNLRVEVGVDPEEFYEHNARVLSGAGDSISYTKKDFMAIYLAAKSRGQCEIIGGYGGDGVMQYAVFFLWDKTTAYILLNSLDQKYKSSGASSLVMFEVIKYASEIVNKVDFCGSMIDSVERSIRKYGAEQVPYFRISKTNSRVLKLLLFFNIFR
jgi:hypothetical protein